MARSADILNELKVLSPVLADISPENLYTLPRSYFDNLSNEMLNFITTEYLVFGKKENKLNVPSGYFEGFAETVLQKIKSQLKTEIYLELQDVAPLLNTINKENIYSVPANYFQNLAVNIIKAQAPKAKVVTFKVARKWLNYAAAAMLAGVLVSGAFLFTDNKSSFDLSKEVNKVSDEDLQNYINNNSHTLVYGTENELNNNSKLPELEENLQSISDDELQQYLNENEENTKKNKQGS